jgi:hypothetical protein
MKTKRVGCGTMKLTENHPMIETVVSDRGVSRVKRRIWKRRSCDSRFKCPARKGNIDSGLWARNAASEAHGQPGKSRAHDDGYFGAILEPGSHSDQLGTKPLSEEMKLSRNHIEKIKAWV